MVIGTVGYIGLGHAGFLMATNLHKAGFNMIVRDADPEREQRFAKENPNARIASEEREAFRDAGIIITMLPQGKVVRQVMLGETGYATGLKAGICPAGGLLYLLPQMSKTHVQSRDHHRRHIVVLAT